MNPCINSSAKKVYLKRNVKIIREHGCSSLTLQRVDSKDQVQAFLKGALSVARHS